MNTEYTFNDVLIKPKYSEVLSRSDVNLGCKIGNHRFNLPVISANMKTITGPRMASIMSDYGGLGVLHRFCTIEDNVSMYKEAVSLCQGDNKTIGVSIGVQDEDKERFTKLFEAGARIFVVDVAHGHHVLVKRMLKWIDIQIPNVSNIRSKMTVVAGNIATPEAYFDLADWGADAVKVGIGPSPVCHTRYATGCGYPQLSALKYISKTGTDNADQKYPSIIADGGLKYVGDIAKALKYSDMVMIGSMLSGTTETPGHVFEGPDGFYKVYGGSASGENKGENKFVEGVTKTVPFRGKSKYILKKIKEGLQSSCSYVGAHNLEQFKHKCEFVLLSGGSIGESKF